MASRPSISAPATPTLCRRVVVALKAEALLNDSVGAGYVDRHWPPALKEAGAWPLASLRQSFLAGALTRLIDPDAALRARIVEFVRDGAFGLASGSGEGGGYERLWFGEPVAPEEVAFEANVFLLTSARAEELRAPPPPDPDPESESGSAPRPGPPEAEPQPGLAPGPAPAPVSGEGATTLRISGAVPPEMWNRLGTMILPKLRSGAELGIHIDITVDLGATSAGATEAELRRILKDLGLEDRVRVGRSRG